MMLPAHLTQIQFVAPAGTMPVVLLVIGVVGVAVAIAMVWSNVSDKRYFVRKYQPPIFSADGKAFEEEDFYFAVDRRRLIVTVAIPAAGGVASAGLVIASMLMFLGA